MEHITPDSDDDDRDEQPTDFDSTAICDRCDSGRSTRGDRLRVEFVDKTDATYSTETIRLCTTCWLALREESRNLDGGRA